ncbi:mRNA surveillance protein pelota [Candidatus Woesearchaeota archaeon]|nr:mRNA surveillance protein pelota [Candidatus Woesearchaeota archaeon]
MQIIQKDLRKGIIKLRIESRDDLWSLHLLLDPGDTISGMTLRKVAAGEETVRRPVRLSIAVEKVEFAKTHPVLRVLGKVTEGPEDVPHGSHHSFAVEQDTIIEIRKDWSQYQLKRLEEAAAENKKPLLICVLDREEAYFALSKRYGYELLTTIAGEVSKKEERARATGSFYDDIITALTEYVHRYDVESVILASPAFWKDDLLKKIRDDALRRKIVLATCSSVKEDAIHEVLTRPEVREVVKRERMAREIALVDDILAGIAKGGNVAYGIKEVAKAVAAGATAMVLVTDKFIHTAHERQAFHDIDDLLRTAEKQKADVHIISSEHTGGARLDGLGGIAAKLRYKTDWS